MKMKTLTVNGQTFPVYDGGTVRYDEAQALTEEQKAQARKNIGVAKAGSGGSLSAQIVDNKLVVNLTGSLSASILDGVLVVEG